MLKWLLGKTVSTVNLEMWLLYRWPIPTNIYTAHDLMQMLVVSPIMAAMLSVSWSWWERYCEHEIVDGHISS
jgi:hypothetical protein